VIVPVVLRDRRRFEPEPYYATRNQQARRLTADGGVWDALWGRHKGEGDCRRAQDLRLLVNVGRDVLAFTPLQFVEIEGPRG
jgi:hypothetical protein